MLLIRAIRLAISCLIRENPWTMFTYFCPAPSKTPIIPLRAERSGLSAGPLLSRTEPPELASPGVRLFTKPVLPGTEPDGFVIPAVHQTCTHTYADIHNLMIDLNLISLPDFTVIGGEGLSPQSGRAVKSSLPGA